MEASSTAIHGLPFIDVVLRLASGQALSGRLGPESVPEGMAPGDQVKAMCAANMLVSIRRP